MGVALSMSKYRWHCGSFFRDFTLWLFKKNEEIKMRFKNITAIMLALLLVNLIGLVGCGSDEPKDTLVVNRDVIDPNNPIYGFGGSLAIQLVGAQHIRATFIVSNARVVGGSWAPNAKPSDGGQFCNPTIQQTLTQIQTQFPSACGFAYGLANRYVLVQAPYEEVKSGFGTVTRIKYLELFGQLKEDLSGIILRHQDAYVNRFDIEKTKFDLKLPLFNEVSIKVDTGEVDHFFRFEVNPLE